MSTTTKPVSEQTEHQLRSKFDQFQAKYVDLAKEVETAEKIATKLRHKRDEFGEQLAELANELAYRTIPFEKGDIVEDDQSVRYRVHNVAHRHSRYTNYTGITELDAKPGTVSGIRLTKTGNEAYAKPREIVNSGSLIKVDTKGGN